MNTTLLKNIGLLLQVRDSVPEPLRGPALGQLPTLRQAWVLVQGQHIAALGTGPAPSAQHTIDLQGATVMPSYVDCHTHLVWAHSREEEWEARLQGKSYEQIAAEGGGILNSAARLRQASQAQLLASAQQRLLQLAALGTAAVEIKSGYGLTVEAELTMLRVARQLGHMGPLLVKTTLLGAHALPPEYAQDRAAYVRLVCQEMIPQAAAQGLADYVDVFCDRGFFTPAETAEILEAGRAHGMPGRLHANELANSGGVQVAVAHGCVSADHLEEVGPEEIALLASSNTLPVLLPGTALFLGLKPPPARAMVQAGLPLVLASDYNPGSCPSGNMHLVASLGCMLLGLQPAEALNAATVNAAWALGLQQQLGWLAPGMRACLQVLPPLPSVAALPYFFGHMRPTQVMLDGEMMQFPVVQ